MDIKNVTGARIWMEMNDGSMNYEISMKKEEKTGKIILRLVMDEKTKSSELDSKYFTHLIKVIETNKLLTWVPGGTGPNCAPFEEGFSIFSGSRAREFSWESPYKNLQGPSNLIDYLFSLKTLIPGVKDHHDHGGCACSGHDHKDEKKEDCCEKDCSCTEKKEECCEKDCSCSEKMEEKKSCCKNEENKKCGNECNCHE